MKPSHFSGCMETLERLMVLEKVPAWSPHIDPLIQFSCTALNMKKFMAVLREQAGRLFNHFMLFVRSY